MDLVTFLRTLDVWQYISGVLFVLYIVEVKFGGRAKASRRQIMEAKLAGYDLATRQLRERERIRSTAELEAEEFAE